MIYMPKNWTARTRALIGRHIDLPAKEAARVRHQMDPREPDRF